MRFLLCSSRVRSLGDPEYLNCHPKEYKLICTIIKHNKNYTFLPGLHKISWALRDGNGLIPPQFAPQALHSLHLTRSGADETLDQRDLVQQCMPFIRTLSVGSHWLMPLESPNAPSIVDIALSLKYLESLQIWEAYEAMPLTPYDIRRLGKSPTIRDLDVHIKGFQETHRGVKLPNIHRLRLVGLAVDISSLLRHVEAPALFDLKLSCKAVHPAQLVDLMRDLGEAPVSGNLRSLSLSASRCWSSEWRFHGDVIYEPDSVWYLSTLLRPCINMVNLQSFEFSTISWENIITDGDDIHEIAQWLPNALQRLSLSPPLPPVAPAHIAPALRPPLPQPHRARVPRARARPRTVLRLFLVCRPQQVLGRWDRRYLAPRHNQEGPPVANIPHRRHVGAVSP